MSAIAVVLLVLSLFIPYPVSVPREGVVIVDFLGNFIYILSSDTVYYLVYSH